MPEPLLEPDHEGHPGPEKVSGTGRGGRATFYRQPALLPEVAKAQAGCEHKLVMVNSATIVCVDCNSFWFK